MMSCQGSFCSSSQVHLFLLCFFFFLCYEKCACGNSFLSSVPAEMTPLSLKHCFLLSRERLWVCFISRSQLFPSQICDAPAVFPFNPLSPSQNICGYSKCTYIHSHIWTQPPLPPAAGLMSSKPCYVYRNMRPGHLTAFSLSCRVFLQEGNHILLLAL